MPMSSVTEVKHNLDIQRAAYHEAYKRANVGAERSKAAAAQAEGLVKDAGEFSYTPVRAACGVLADDGLSNVAHCNDRRSMSPGHHQSYSSRSSC